MAPEQDPGYLVWGVDNVVYGPVDLPVLVGWVQEGRVTAETWIHLQHLDSWQKACQLPELQMFFQQRRTAAALPATVEEPDTTRMFLKPGALRRVKILACLSDRQLEEFVQYMEVKRVRQWEEIVREGNPGDAMYLLLDGEVRVRVMIGGKETIMATLGPGEFFGEVALFDHGPRSADVLANSDCVLLRIPAASFQRLVEGNPTLAAPFLFAVSRTLISRFRANNKRYRDSVAFARTAQG